MNPVEKIQLNGECFAIIIYHDYTKDGVAFFTPDDFSQQLGYMKHKKGDVIPEHVHNLQIREIQYTQETLVVKRGRLRVDLYTNGKNYLTSRELTAGDVILLASGGHGFEFLEETEMIEIKQGPYCGDQDKIRFNGEKP